MGLLQGRRFTVSSSLPVDVVRARLDDALQGHRGTFGASLGPAGVVRGNVRQDKIELVAMHAGLGIWSPTALQGWLRATPTGCVVYYDIDWPLTAQVFGAIWLGAFVLALVGGAAIAGYQAIAGHVDAAGLPALVAGCALVATLLFFGLVAVLRSASRDQVALLHGWLAERVQTPN
ncbi:hypothetical protein [Dactylosporangium vinaceum]|uniref:Uncharacterized protein n=1 Tax=Dactylosporangium vinaceum TaxID=53362 RepID=A0ABV5M168_9ACTN|nr:hypothetical protein [Dactylosporangium vinaceum]